MLRKNCVACHNKALSSGGLSLDGVTAASSIAADRDAWERIVAKIRTGEMPPKGAPKPAPESIQAFVAFVTSAIDRADRSRPPDPGRILARRLNRNEYANTIRDLLGVRFRAAEEFPADDSVLGFDNIGEVLTVSPLLMEKYVYAAERIAALAIAADPLPKPSLTELKADRVRRLDAGASEIVEHIDHSGEYVFRVWVRGHRGPKGEPALLKISVDGKPVHAVDVPTLENETATVARDVQRINREVRVYLAAGPHTFHAELDGPDFRKPVPRPRRGGPGFGPPPPDPSHPEKFDLLGPFAAPGTHPPRAKILTCDPATGPACLERILKPLARKAYRRPATASEIAQLISVAREATAAGFKPDQAVQYAVAAMLVSPHFLFRVERDPKGQYGPVSELELATRLSYFLWSSTPDDELLMLAETRQIRKPGVLDAQITRMLADSRSSALAENFSGQWLETRGLQAAKPDILKFPMWNATLQLDLAAETSLFFEHILRENRPATEFITADYTFLNPRLARHYGLPDLDGPDFRKVQVDPNQRGGVLGHGSVLTITSYPVRTSPVLRGKYILDVILGTPPPPPPADVPALNEDQAQAPSSLRAALEKHRSDPICASCHSRMDPLGFGLENYDPIGRWRTEEKGAPIQVGGTLPNGADFTTPAQLKDLLKQDLPGFTRNLTEKMMTYALGRGLDSYDRPVVRDIVRKVEADEYRLQTLIREIARSLPFQARRGLLRTEEVKPAKNMPEVASK